MPIRQILPPKMKWVPNLAPNENQLLKKTPKRQRYCHFRALVRENFLIHIKIAQKAQSSSWLNKKLRTLTVKGNRRGNICPGGGRFFAGIALVGLRLVYQLLFAPTTIYSNLPIGFFEMSK